LSVFSVLSVALLTFPVRGFRGSCLSPDYAGADPGYDYNEVESRDLRLIIFRAFRAFRGACDLSCLWIPWLLPIHP
ncbi:MAG TPA: hypothetical protein VKA48_00090, partial [Gammaproteobacteria bacterium]|nr:hypothetical protein [Gammaproteobacteria bacterium]